jgi:hypothetical protein
MDEQLTRPATDLVTFDLGVVVSDVVNGTNRRAICAEDPCKRGAYQMRDHLTIREGAV